jgi:hypothetical protein
VAEIGTMADNPFDVEARHICAALPCGPRLVVIGSGSFWGADSHPLCEAIAADLAAVAELVAVTGGRRGVGLTFGRAFAVARRAAGFPENLFHLLPHGTGRCENGVTVGAGRSAIERREVLGRVGHACLVIEGGPGTQYEAAVATGCGVPVIPLGRTGGHAGELHQRSVCPPEFPKADWALLADPGAAQEQVSAAVGRLVRVALARRSEPRGAAPRGDS